MYSKNASMDQDRGVRYVCKMALSRAAGPASPPAFRARGRPTMTGHACPRPPSCVHRYRRYLGLYIQECAWATRSCGRGSSVATPEL